MAKNSNTTATGQVVVGVGNISGVIVSSHTSGTFKLVDSPNSTIGRVLVETWTLAAGPQVITFPEPLDFYEGVHAVIGGTAVLQFVYTKHS